MHENVVAALYHLYLADGPLTTTELAKRVFDPDGTDEVRNADRKVRHYLEDSFPHLVSVEKENGSKQFTLAEDTIWFGLGTVQVVTADYDEIGIGLGRTLVYLDDEGEPEVISMEIDTDGDDLPDPDDDDLPDGAGL